MDSQYEQLLSLFPSLQWPLPHVSLHVSLCVCFCDVPVGAAEVELVGHKGETSAANMSGFQKVDGVWLLLG